MACRTISLFCQAFACILGYIMDSHAILKLIPTDALLTASRSSLLLRLFKYRPILWLDERVRQDSNANISMILGALVNSRSPRYSERLLSCLAVIPRDVLESNQSLRSYFLTSHIECDSVHDAIKVCREAIRLCFSAK